MVGSKNSGPRMKPGAGGGPVQNAKAQPQQKQAYGKGKGAAKYPAKAPGAKGDNPRKGKTSPFAPKGKK
jgi:hypothetical protein